ncbi:uncharacterized protein [Eurosta solidaginis]|uniref:uncharacterized protein n=1 Tax=Eurosta solidaginis TaxID=178769 RepID=UPI0035308D9E
MDQIQIRKAQNANLNCVNKMLRLIFIIIITSYMAACYADLLSIYPNDFQQSNDIKIATIINTPTAVSHTTFTRVHNHQSTSSTKHSQDATVAQLSIVSTTAPQTTAVHQTSPVVMQTPIYTTTTTHHLETSPQTIVTPMQPALQAVNHIMTVTTATSARDDTPIVQPLTHTPAHLTFAARPVIYQMLPNIKPVRKISFDEFVPSPRNKQGVQQR